MEEKTLHKLTARIMRLLRCIPSEEDLCIKKQIWRTTYSISSSMWEHNTVEDFYQNSQIAIGSLTELQNSCLLVHDLNYMSFQEFEEIDSLISELRAQLLWELHEFRPNT